MSGYAFHPDAFADLDEILEYIAQDNIAVLTGYSQTSTPSSAPSRPRRTSDIDGPT